MIKLRQFLLASGVALGVLGGAGAPFAMAQNMPDHNQDHGAPMQHPPMGGPQGHDPQHFAQAPMQHDEGPMQGHDWHNGDHYSGRRQVVGDWQHHHLHQPPPGYEWVQNGDQFVLIAVASGVIADVIANAVNN